MILHNLTATKVFCCYSCRENGQIKRLMILEKPYFCDNCGNLFTSLKNYYSRNDRDYWDDYISRNGITNSEAVAKSTNVNEFAIPDFQVEMLANQLVSQDKIIESNPGYTYYQWNLNYIIGKSGQKTLKGFTKITLLGKVFVWLEP